MQRTISMMVGKGSLNHNNRTFIWKDSKNGILICRYSMQSCTWVSYYTTKSANCTRWTIGI